MKSWRALTSQTHTRCGAALFACSALLSGCGLWSNDSIDTRGGPGAGSAGIGLGGAMESGGVNQGGAASSSAGGNGGGDPCIPGFPPVTSQIPRLLDRQYENVMRDLLGITQLPDDGNGGNASVSQLLIGDFDGAMNAPAWRVYQDVGEKIVQAVMKGQNRSKFISCDPAQAGCLEETIRRFGRKAFRRPLTDAEVARFQKLGPAMPDATPEELAETTLFAFLTSPSFLLLPELTPDPGGSKLSIELSNYEVATRLSLLLWGSIPDDELDKAADANQLRTKEQILSQARRMVLIPSKASPLMIAFHHFWSQMDSTSGHWWKSRHDPDRFPLYTSATPLALLGEMDAFFDAIAFGHGTYRDLFLSTVAFVNRDTAAIYGLDPTRYGEDLTRVQLDAEQRSGFLTRAGFLSSYSAYDSSNPFLRGTFIANSLLRIELPPPLPGANVPISGDFKTNREYTEALTRPAQCQSCHAIINPWGYTLENYDAIGKWQTVDQRGGAIDATARVNLGNGEIEPISTPLQLMQELAKAPQVRRGYAESWVSFAFNRNASKTDICAIEELDHKLANDGYAVLDIPPDITQLDSFRLRSQATP